MNEMSCSAARAALLEADIAELRAEHGGELGRHLAHCPTCAALAARLLQGYRDLDTGLAALAPPRRRRGITRTRAWAVVPLAAAALAVLLLLPRESSLPAPSPLLMQLLFPETSVVTPKVGQQAMVLENEDLTVVWLYQENGDQP